MKRNAYFLLLGLAAFALIAAVGANPRYIEEIRIGGGYEDTDGGVDIDKTGNIVSSATATVNILAVTDDATIGDDLTVTGDLSVTGSMGIVDGDIPAAITRDTEWDTESEVETVWSKSIYTSGDADFIDGAQLADTITLDAPLTINGNDVKIGDDLYIGNAESGDNDFLYFDNGNEHIRWDNTAEQFALSDDLAVGITSTSDNDYIYFDDGSTNYLFWENANDRFVFNNDLVVFDDLRIGHGAADDDDFLYFDNGNESISWDNNPGEFDISDDVNISGSMTASGTASFGDNGSVPTGVLSVQQSSDNISGGLILYDSSSKTGSGFFKEAGSDGGIVARSQSKNTLLIKGGNVGVGVGATSPSGRLEIDVGSSDAVPALVLDQNDEDQPFIGFEGTLAGDLTKNITSDGSAVLGGPAYYLKVNVNGAEYWMPLYIDTSE